MNFIDNNVDNNIENKNSKGIFGFLKRKKRKKQDYFARNKENKEYIKNYNESLKNEQKKKENSPSVQEDSSFKKISSRKEKLVEKVKKWRSSGVIQTNLIKNEVVVYIDWQKNIIISIVYIFIFFVLVGGSYYGINSVSKKASDEAEKLSKETLKLNNKFKEIKKSIVEVDVFRRRAGIVKLYLDKHIYWTNFFKEIEDNTLNNVYYGDVASYNGNIGNNKYNFTVKATEYKDIPNQLRVLRRGEFISDVEATQGELEQIKNIDGDVTSSVNFVVNFVVDNNVFYKSDDEVKINDYEKIIQDKNIINKKEVNVEDINWE
ncbi:hypothetical protein KAI92_01930 [Candidatus Parcubacteria bacterium]|nr:hypothetical protein [Candidatus Parcubacteria bacterium]